MSDARDPVRLMDARNVDPALRAALRQVSGTEPGAAELAALVERVGDALNGSAGGASWFSQFISHGGGFKLMALLVAGGATVWGATKSWPTEQRRELAAVSAHEVAPAALSHVASAGDVPAEGPAVVRVPGLGDEGPVLSVADSAQRASASAAIAHDAPSRPRRVEQSVHGAAAGPARGGLARATSTTRVESSASAATTRARAADEAQQRTEQRADEGEESELALITRAQSALKLAPRRALELLDRHDALYPTGHFAEEREVLWIDALSQLGMTRALDARGKRFLASYPSSIHCARVRTLLSAARARR